jgi:hypothetical protein
MIRLLRLAKICATGLATFIAAPAFAEVVRIGPLKSDCSVCMPGQPDCNAPKIPAKAAIAQVSGAKLRKHIFEGCPDVIDTPCERYSSSSLYTFQKMSFFRNDFKANEKALFEAYYYFPVSNRTKWGGVYLREDRSYVIVATERGLYGYPGLNFVCELSY